jgi:hypothetical protein
VDEVGEADTAVASVPSRPASSRPTGLGWWLRVTAFHLDGPEALLVSVQVASQMSARVLHVGGPFHPWVRPFGSLEQTDLKCTAQDQGKCVSFPLD